MDGRSGGLPRRVIKIGGSLLSRPDLPEAVERWWASLPPAIDLVLVGGGELVDAIRHLDAVRPGDAAETHWRCVRLLETTFEIVREWFPHWRSISTEAAFEAALRDGFAEQVPNLLSVSTFYRPGLGIELPEDWRTTTDAIAGALAIRLEAESVVLLKSCRVDPTAGLETLSRHGIVDEAIVDLAGQLGDVQVTALPQVR